MSDDTSLTELYHLLPDDLRSSIKQMSTKSELLLLLRWYFGRGNYLREKGWFESERKGFPVDGDGEAIPWYSYPIIEFLEGKLPRDLRVFEYGSGQSSVWWAERSTQVTAIEHDDEWARHTRQRAPENLEVLQHADREAYVGSIAGRGPFDVVIIDGKWRPACFEPAVAELSETGVILLDDSLWEHMRNDAVVEAAGLKALPFYGPKALGAQETCTTIFYRDGNCLDI